MLSDRPTTGQAAARASRADGGVWTRTLPLMPVGVGTGTPFGRTSGTHYADDANGDSRELCARRGPATVDGLTAHQAHVSLSNSGRRPRDGPCQVPSGHPPGRWRRAPSPRGPTPGPVSPPGQKTWRTCCGPGTSRLGIYLKKPVAMVKDLGGRG